MPPTKIEDDIAPHAFDRRCPADEDLIGRTDTAVDPLHGYGRKGARKRRKVVVIIGEIDGIVGTGSER